MIASGLGLNYNSWIGDLESVNFASMRSGAQDEQEEFLIKQTLIREGVLIPVFENWLRMALLNRAVDLEPRNFDLLNKPNFAGRRWGFYDPVKDVTAIKLALETNLTTLEDELASQGIDFNDWFVKKKNEITRLGELQKLKKQFGLTEGKPEQPSAPSDPDDENDDEPTNGKANKNFIKILTEN
jgi:capsid protein